MAIFTGAGVAIVTPFNADGSVNYDKFGEQIEYQISHGTDAIIVCGTTGESATLTEEEHSAVIKYCIEKVNHRIPVIAGTGSNCTATAIKLSKEAQKDGADGLLIVTPYYNKGTQNGLKAHYTAIANAVDIPIILYNVPSRTGVTLSAATIADLCKNVKNIVGLKDATGNLSMTADVMSLAAESVDLYSGNDDQIVPIMSLGGIGVISVLSNIAPAQTHDICAKYLEGDVKTAAKLQLEAIPLVRALFSEVNPIPVKKAMNLMGMQAGPLRMPLTEMEDATASKLEEAMKNYGLL